MKKSLKMLLLFVCVVFFATGVYAEEEFRFPGEFEKQDSVRVGWLSKEYIKGYKTDDVMVEMIANLVPEVHVVICIPHASQKEHVKGVLQEHGVSEENISWYEIPFTTLYWRDFGPIFTINAQGTKKSWISTLTAGAISLTRIPSPG